MKQRPIHELESVAVQKALATTKPFTVEDARTEALLTMVAKEAARELVTALYAEGYLSTAKAPPIDPFAFTPLLMGKSDKVSAEQIAGPLADMAITLLGEMLKKKPSGK